MSRMRSKPTAQPVPEADARIEKLQRQCRRFEEKGVYDSPQHQTLAALLGNIPPVESAESVMEDLKDDGN